VHDSQEATALMRNFDGTVSSTQSLSIALAIIAVLIAAAIAFTVVRQLAGSVRNVIKRMAEVEKGARENLVVGLQSLAGGNLTVELDAATEASSDFAKDELGLIMHQVEAFRDAMIACYAAYNQTAASLRELIGEVTSTAGSVGAASREMSSSSEESGKATGEIAHAVGDIAQGAERQVQMIAAAKQSAEEVSRAVSESAENAQRTAEVAHQAREFAQHGVGAAEQANDAMRSVRDSSETVNQAIRELASKSGQIGAIVQTITGIAEQTNLLALNAAIEAARAGEQGRRVRGGGRRGQEARRGLPISRAGDLGLDRCDPDRDQPRGGGRRRWRQTDPGRRDGRRADQGGVPADRRIG
jgi:methyl-accepting chemotaxis protein